MSLLPRNLSMYGIWLEKNNIATHTSSGMDTTEILTSMVLEWEEEEVEFFKKVEEGSDISYDMWKVIFISISRIIYFSFQNSIFSYWKPPRS